MYCRRKSGNLSDCSTELRGQGIGAQGARQIANKTDRIDYSVYVEPFLGRGDIYRATRPESTEILADKDCRRTAQAKKAACRGTSSCERIKDARVSCGRDWKAYLKHDSPSTLFMLDPPWEDVTARGMNYRENKTISAKAMVATTRKLKGGVAIVYKDTSANRRVLCKKPFRCSLIRKNFFGRGFTQLLAVKQPSGKRQVARESGPEELIRNVTLRISG